MFSGTERAHVLPVLTQTNEVGTLHYVLVAQGAMAPTPTEVLLRQGSGGNATTVMACGSLSTTAANTVSQQTVVGYTEPCSHKVSEAGCHMQTRAGALDGMM